MPTVTAATDTIFPAAMHAIAVNLSLSRRLSAELFQYRFLLTGNLREIMLQAYSFNQVQRKGVLCTSDYLP
jgi:hypothetical protein